MYILLTPAYDGPHVLLVTWRPERGADPLAYAAGSFPAAGLPVSQRGPAEDRGYGATAEEEKSQLPTSWGRSLAVTSQRSGLTPGAYSG